MSNQIRFTMFLLAAVAAGVLLINTPSREVRAAFPGENGMIAFTRVVGSDTEIFTMTATGDQETQITDNGVFDGSPRWSPDGEKIVFHRGNPNLEIWTMNADGSGQQMITAGANASWSPDGKRLIYNCPPQGGGYIDICTTSASPGGSVTVFKEHTADLSFRAPAWSPAGDQVAVEASGGPGLAGIWVMNADGSGERQLTTGTAHSPQHDWSPDGQRIIYETAADGIFAVDSDGGSPPEQLVPQTGDVERNRTAGFSPDGVSIVWAKLYVDPGIWRRGVSGGTPIRLTTDGSDLEPDWQPLKESLIHSVEFTQAIQQLQTLAVLKDDLSADGKPPVPMVAGKPAVMRIYFLRPEHNTTLDVEVSGVVGDEKRAELSTECSPEDRRERAGNCDSVDFYFTPPAGNWSVTLRVSDEVGLLESHTFNLASVTTAPARIVPVDVCDRQSVPFIGTWECQYGFNLWPNSDLLRATFPGEVVFEASAGQIRNRTDVQDFAWWGETLDMVRDLWVASGASTARYYHGAVRSEGSAAVTGLALVGSNAALTQVPSPAGTRYTFAHEATHNFGREHVPSAGGGSACLANPPAPDSGWPYSNPFINEVGFNVETGEVLDSDLYTDYMSYCSPSWVSIYTYLGVLQRLQQSARVQPEGAELGDYWLISGEISEAGDSANLDFITEIYTEGPAGAGSGQYRIEVLDAADDVLVTRHFDAHVASGEDGDSLPRFSELVRIPGGPDRIVIKGPGNNLLAEVPITGARPQVAVSGLSRQGASGEMVLSWTINDPDSSDHESWVQYSTDGGATWEVLTPRIPGTQLALDAGKLAGSDNARFQVLVSDGVLTGQAQSEVFSVATKPPVADITGPSATSFREGQLVWLTGMGFDEEDGFLDGSDVRWSSSRDGNLGTGAQLHVYDLSVGSHTITMRAEDSNGGEATDTITVTVTAGGVSESGQISGDINCSGAVDSVDGLGISRFVAGLSVGQTQPCPAIGVNGHGDVNCDGTVTAVDSLFVLRHVAGLPVNLPGGCRPIGT